MAWKSNTIDTDSVYIIDIAESLDKSRLFIEVLSDPTTAREGDHFRVYELYRYGKTATGSSGNGKLGTTPIYEEGAMWIED